MTVFPSKAAANEILSPPPRWGMTLLSDTSAFVADRFAFRQEFITAWARLQAALFRTSAENQVTLGKDGWLYYSESLDDYTGVSLSDKELDDIAVHLAGMQKEAEEAGCRFLFTVAPNKNSIYSANMPEQFVKRHEDSSIERLQPYLKKYAVNYVDLYPLFHEGDGLYYRTDSHWTAKGAAAAADALTGSNFAAGPFSESEVRKGDLYEMLYPAADGEENEVVFNGELNYETIGNAQGGEAITIHTVSNAGSGRLLCFRDSFGISLYPYLASSFEEALFTRSVSFQFDKYDLADYDTVIVEIVERNLNYLLEK